MSFVGSYIWKLRQVVGQELVVSPGAVTVIVNAHGAVLLLKRTDTGQWCLPGGATEPGSTFASTAVEEVQEEVGLDVEERDLVAFASLSDERWTHFTFPNGDVVHSFNLCFTTDRWSGATRADGQESLEVDWFSPLELPEPMLPMSDQVLELWRKYRRDGQFQAN